MISQFNFVMAHHIPDEPDQISIASCKPKFPSLMFAQESQSKTMVEFHETAASSASLN
jgi:hypothetical protein